MKIEITTSYSSDETMTQTEVVDFDEYVDSMSDEDYALLCEWEGGPTVENLCRELASHDSQFVTCRARQV